MIQGTINTPNVGCNLNINCHGLFDLSDKATELEQILSTDMIDHPTTEKQEVAGYNIPTISYGCGIETVSSQALSKAVGLETESRGNTFHHCITTDRNLTYWNQGRRDNYLTILRAVFAPLTAMHEYCTPETKMDIWFHYKMNTFELLQTSGLVWGKSMMGNKEWNETIDKDFYEVYKINKIEQSPLGVLFPIGNVFHFLEGMMDYFLFAVCRENDPEMKPMEIIKANVERSDFNCRSFTTLVYAFNKCFYSQYWV